MKTKFIDRFTLLLLQKNALYIALLLFFSGLILIYVPTQLITYRELIKKNDDLTAQLAEYKTKRSLILTFAPDKLTELASTLAILLPTHEDYFSILTTLEQLSSKTGLQIVSYEVGMTPNQTSTIQLTVSAEGTPDSFNAFLTEYRSGGGRFITIHELELSPRESKISLVLFFHSYPTNGAPQESKHTGLDAETVLRLEQIESQLRQASPIDTSGSTENQVPNYPVKANPFE